MEAKKLTQLIEIEGTEYVAIEKSRATAQLTRILDAQANMRKIFRELDDKFNIAINVIYADMTDMNTDLANLMYDIDEFNDVEASSNKKFADDNGEQW